MNLFIILRKKENEEFVLIERKRERLLAYFAQLKQQ